MSSVFNKSFNDYLRDQKSEDPIGDAVKKVKKAAPVLSFSAAPGSTTDYGQFKSLTVNREVDKTHVRKLITAIKQRNLLHLNPIVVNDKMQVVDGQHRLEAAKTLKVPIYFIKDAAVSEDDISGMNSVKKNWTINDYINYFSTKGNKEYVRFSRICNRHPDFKPSLLLSICSTSGKRGNKDVQEGRIDIMSDEECDRIIGMVNDFAEFTPLYRSARFIEAVSFFFHSKVEPAYDHERMMQKVRLHPYLLTPQANKEGFIKMLQQLYNRGVREDNIVMFLKR